MNTPAASTRRTRSDKERNRSHMHDIAKRAGLGPGTLYRHFPTREALLAALLQARWDKLQARRRAIEEHQEEHHSDSVAALEAWLQALSEYVTIFDGLPDPLRVALSQDTSPLAITCEGLVETTGHFLAAVQREDRAYSWVTARELFLGVLAMVWVRGAILADGASTTALQFLLRTGWEKTPAATDPPS
jgi:AcrR family transcriptional regulator